MIGSTILQYTILEEIGRGGMGVVYKARDTKLDRIVGLKFLPLHLTEHETERARFLQEARAASALNHPNVCVIHDIEEADGQQFIVMEFVDGQTLRQRIASAPGGLPVDQAITFAIQAGEALQEAHRKGIVHRDVKAENIMVTASGQIKVMDFGLAKLKGSMKLTRTSSTVGTLAYMAPEQIQGSDVDARSDIFSLGIVLFETLTGQTPFRGEHEAAMMYSILNEEPQSLEQYRKDCPPDLDRIVRRALEKDPEDRYQHADDLVSELRRMKKQTTRVVRPAAVPAPQGPSGGVLPTSARAQAAGPWWRSRVFQIPVALLVVIGCAYFLLRGPSTESIRSMAVLPFTNVSGDATTEYLSDGLTEGLINTLSRLPGIKMMSSRSVFRYKGQDVDPQVAARELHVGAVLTGRVLQQGDNLSISVELINAQDNSHLWGEQYVRRSSDLLAVQSAISREISSQLRIAMTGDQERQLEAPPTQNAGAYQLFLKGRFALNQRTAQGFDNAIAFFRQAIGLDPSFARAYAGLAETYVLKGSYFLLPVEKATDSVRTAARKALDLDATIGEAHTVLASSSEWTWDWPAAENEYRRSIELSPNFATAHQWYGEFLCAMGRFEEGLKEIRKAQELDPLSPIVYVSYANTLMFLRRYDEALQQIDKALELNPRFPRAISLMSIVYFLEGKIPDAIREGERAVVESDSSFEYLAWMGYVYGRTGRRQEAERLLADLRRRSAGRFASPSHFALIYGGLGDADRAFTWLNRAVEVHDTALEYMKVDPSFDMLRGDPRFAELIKKVGLPQ